MKIQELFNKVLTLDSAKEYSIVESGGSTAELDKDKDKDKDQNKNQNKDKDQNKDQTKEKEQNIDKEVLEELRKANERIKVLESANQALLNNTVVSEKKKSFDDCVLGLCGGQIYGKTERGSEPER